MAWTDERIETLRKMWEGGQTASQIAEELGGVSRNAVIGKAHRLGLQSRPSPVKPNEPQASAAATPPAQRGGPPRPAPVAAWPPRRAEPKPAPVAAAPAAAVAAPASVADEVEDDDDDA